MTSRTNFPTFTKREARLFNAVVLAQEELDQAKGGAREACHGYAQRRPLLPKEHAALVRRVKGGEPIRGRVGLRWLGDTVPGIWASAINTWANGIPRAELLKRVRALRRDMLPCVPDWCAR